MKRKKQNVTSGSGISYRVIDKTKCNFWHAPFMLILRNVVMYVHVYITLIIVVTYVHIHVYYWNIVIFPSRKQQIGLTQLGIVFSQRINY